MNDDTIILDQKKLAAISTNTRIKILKTLVSRQMTISELSRCMDCAKSTLLKNLKIMEDAGFIEVKRNENKWVYYKLTHDGKALLQSNYPEKTNQFKIMIVLGFSSIVSLSFGIIALLNLILKPVSNSSDSIDSLPAAINPTFYVYFFFFFGFVSLLIFWKYIFKKRKSQKLALN
ncbi:winged helix-turn-helix domain-containing protein [Methanococcoides burtonii]|nr:winged helix-turn-helix domain-containing protein [Methanococcoides burtonii]